MGLGDFKTKSSTNTQTTTSTDESHGTRLEQGDRIKSGVNHKYHINTSLDDVAEYWVNGRMAMWETESRRRGNWFLRQYDSRGNYKGPDPQFTTHEEIPPQEEWPDEWVDATEDWQEALVNDCYINHDCGAHCRRGSREFPWARCPGCNTVLIDTKKRDNMSKTDSQTASNNTIEGGQSGLGSFVGGVD
jgi:hypothetical protein